LNNKSVKKHPAGLRRRGENTRGSPRVSFEKEKKQETPVSIRCNGEGNSVRARAGGEPRGEIGAGKYALSNGGSSRLSQARDP